MGPVRQNPIQRTVSLFICVCIALFTIVAQNIAQNRPDSFPPYPPDNHHISNDVYLREGGIYESRKRLLNFGSYRLRLGPSSFTRTHLRLKGQCFPQHLCTVRQGNECTTTLPLEVFSQRNFVADFIQLKLTFIPKKGKVRFLSHPLGDLEVTYALRLQLVGKPVYNFLFVIIDFFFASSYC